MSSSTAVQKTQSKVELEIQELQRKFRVLENDKRAYSEDAQGIIRKQRATIEKLTRENRKMKLDLNDTRAVPASRAEHRIAAEKLQKAQEQREVLDTRLFEENERRSKLKHQEDLLVTNIQYIRDELARKGGLNAARIADDSTAKQISTSENRLNTSLQKFNEVIAGNKELRGQIDSLRRERLVFDSIYRKLEGELQQKKKEMANIIEQANAAYEARDQAQAQMAALKQQADKEHAEFEKEWKELGRLIENDKKMKEFMRQKERRRLEESAKDASAKQEDEKKKAAKNAAVQLQMRDEASRLNAEKLRIYEEAFYKIQAATGITNIDELVQTFANAEDQNFFLFNYANSLCAEFEKLEQRISGLKSEVSSLKGVSINPQDNDKQKALIEIEEQWSKSEKKADHYELLYQQSSKTLASVRAAIQSIFGRIGCNTQDTIERIGTSHITEFSMLKFLGSIEERSQDILVAYLTSLVEEGKGATLFGEHKGRKGGASASTSAGVSKGQAQFKLPSTVEDFSEEEEEEEEDDQRPFNRDELKLKTLRSLQRRHEGQKKVITQATRISAAITGTGSQ